MKSIKKLIVVTFFLLLSTPIVHATTAVLDNGIAKFTIDDFGVLDAYLGSVDLLDKMSAKIYADELGGTYDLSTFMITQALGDIGGGVYQSTLKKFIPGTAHEVDITMNAKLLPNKKYLDITYRGLYSDNGTTIHNVQFTLYMDPAGITSGVFTQESSGATQWQMRQDLVSSWVGHSNWGNPEWVGSASGPDGVVAFEGINPNVSDSNWIDADGTMNMQWNIGPLTSPGAATFYIDARLETAPEPCTCLLLGAGLVGVAGRGLRRKVKKA